MNTWHAIGPGVGPEAVAWTTATLDASEEAVDTSVARLPRRTEHTHGRGAGDEAEAVSQVENCEPTSRQSS
ncbi:hypothetical protein GCM10027059_15160 [Myceligenerans halotolerans]